MRKRPFFVVSAFAALTVGGAPVAAQTTSPITQYGTAATTGMVGVAASQIAQINVVNLAAPLADAPIIPCAVQLEFWDAAGKMVKSEMIGNLAPGVAAMSQFKPSPTATGAALLRTEIRGVVRSNPIAAASAVAYPAGCNTMMTSLEVFDAATGATHILTTDMRPLRAVEILPPRM
ncbi:MAG: hypothetical protein LAQ30_18440 [Acidobacteriia bacterium]|nr:hypothetical protein [Terriglobia bacterium]